MHINEDHFIAEIIDPNTGEVLPDGAEGRAGVHQHHQGGVPAAALPHAGYLRAHRANSAPAAARM